MKQARVARHKGKFAMKDFILLVEEMRRAQRAYFRRRTDEDRQNSKRLEALVDAWIKREKERNKEAGTQASLFS